jgi:hypothetical protein
MAKGKQDWDGFWRSQPPTANMHSASETNSASTVVKQEHFLTWPLCTGGGNVLS